MKEKEYVPNNVYKFRLSVDLPVYPFEVTVPTKIVKDGWNRVDEFDNDEDAVMEAYFTMDKIREYKQKLIEMIENMSNPFDIFCADKDGDYMFTEDDLFRKPKDFCYF